MLDLAGYSQNPCQKIANYIIINWYPGNKSSEWLRMVVPLFTAEVYSIQFIDPTVEPGDHLWLLSCIMIWVQFKLFLIKSGQLGQLRDTAHGRLQTADCRRQTAGPPFQDLMSGWKQPESDNNHRSTQS